MNKSPVRPFLLMFLGAFLALEAGANDAIRIAVIGDGDDALRSLLEARLSAFDGISLIERAVPQGVIHGGVVLKRTAPGEAEQMALLDLAMTRLAEFEALGARLDRIRGDSTVRLQPKMLRHRLLKGATDLLRRNDDLEAPRNLSAFRARVRELARMDPDGSRMPDSLIMAAFSACVWAENEGELVRFLEKILRSRYPTYFPSTPDTALGPRFRKNPQAGAAWDAMRQRLLDDPDTRLRALHVFSGKAETPEKEEMYREFLRELGRQAASLHERGLLEACLVADSCDSYFYGRFHPERTDLLVAICRAAPGYVEGLFPLVNGLKIPPGREEEVWAAFAGYKERCLASEKDPSKTALIRRQFSSFSGMLMRNNPAIQRREADTALTVRRLWHPYALEQWKGRAFFFNEIATDGRSVWILGVGEGVRDVLEIQLPSLQATSHRFDGLKMAGGLAVSAEAVWLSGGFYPGEDRPMRTFLMRRDRASGEVRQYPLDLPRKKMDLVGGRVFLRFDGDGNNSGLAELDPQSGEIRMLASARRNPPQSPFDAQPDWSAFAVFLGPGGRLCVAAGGASSGIFEMDGRKLAEFRYADALDYDSCSLLVGTRGEAWPADPAQPRGQWWLADPKSGDESARSSARWRWPDRGQNLRGGAAAFRRDELFVVQRNRDGGHSLRWWFADGPPEGLEVPLRFALDADESQALEPLREALKDQVVNLDGLKNPDRVSYSLRVLAAAEGLILHHRANGFWFLPNADLEAWGRDKLPASNPP